MIKICNIIIIPNSSNFQINFGQVKKLTKI